MSSSRPAVPSASVQSLSTSPTRIVRSAICVWLTTGLIPMNCTVLVCTVAVCRPPTERGLTTV